MATPWSQTNGVPPVQRRRDFGLWRHRGVIGPLWAAFGADSDDARLGGRSIIGSYVRSFKASFHGELTMHRLYWVRQLRTRNERHPRWLLFFHIDWAPEILEAMKIVEVPFGKHRAYPSLIDYHRDLPLIPIVHLHCDLLAPKTYVSFFNKLNCLNCYAQDRKPAGLKVCNWSFVPVELLRRHLHRHYLSALTIALIYITLTCFERSFLFVVP